VVEVVDNEAANLINLKKFITQSRREV